MATAETLRRSSDDIKEELLNRLDTSNPEALPEIEKIVVNVGLGDARENVERLETVQEHLSRITGQQPIVTRARKSIADFNLRKGDPSGVKVTLRGQRKDDFLHRVIHFALPMTKEFRGLSPDGFDNHANYSFGIDEQVVFPEIAFDEAEIIFGMDITIVTSTKNIEEAFELLSLYEFPFAES
jgi:large subunit ribosomal protein L5